MVDVNGVQLIFSKQAELIWPDIKHLIEKVLPYCEGEYDCEDIRRLIQEQAALLLVVWENSKPKIAIVISPSVFPSGKEVMNIVACGGVDTTPHFYDAFNIISEIGKNMGCSAIRIYGRRGWEKVLNKHGFRPIQLVLEKEI